MIRRYAVRVLATAGIWALCLTTGCSGFFVYPGSTSGAGNGSSTGDYVYIANATTSSLDAFSVGTGMLTKITSYPLGFIPSAVLVNSANTMVVVTGISLGGVGYIDTLSIGSGGALSLLNSGSNTFGVNIAAMDISPDGNWLVGADQATVLQGIVTLDEFQISSNGQLTAGGAITPFSFSNAGSFVPSAVKFAPNGATLYVAGGTAGDVMYSFNAALNSGAIMQPVALTYLSGAASGADNALAVSADSANNQYLFIAHSNGNAGSILIFKNGLQDQLGSMPAGTQPISVALNKAGTDIYLANQLSGSISGYGVSSGTLSVLMGSPYALVSTTAGLRGLVADNSGNYMLAITNSTAPYLALLSIDSSGALFTVASGAETAGAVAIAATH